MTGRFYGNLFRFINHSCDPNCFIQPVLSHHLDRSRPDVNIFTMRTIFPGEEISYDYGQYHTPSLNTGAPLSTFSGTTWKNGWEMIADVVPRVVRSVTLRWNHEELLSRNDVTSELLSVHCSVLQANRTLSIFVCQTHLRRADQRPNIRTLPRHLFPRPVHLLFFACFMRSRSRLFFLSLLAALYVTPFRAEERTSKRDRSHQTNTPVRS